MCTAEESEYGMLCCSMTSNSRPGELHSIPLLIPVSGRGDPFLLMEHSAEIQRVFIPYDMADLSHRVGGGLQKHLGVGDTDGDNILERRTSGIFFKIADKPAYAHSPGGGIHILVIL